MERGVRFFNRRLRLLICWLFFFWDPKNVKKRLNIMVWGVCGGAVLGDHGSRSFLGCSVWPPNLGPVTAAETL
jgi:hypothetical protein